MQVGGPIPFHAARAYGLARPAATARAPSLAKTEPVVAASPPARVGAQGGTGDLVAARVPGGVDFSGSVPTPSGPSLQLYTRAADKVEAATAVLLGRGLDVRG